MGLGLFERRRGRDKRIAAADRGDERSTNRVAHQRHLPSMLMTICSPAGPVAATATHVFGSAGRQHPEHLARSEPAAPLPAK